MGTVVLLSGIKAKTACTCTRKYLTSNVYREKFNLSEGILSCPFFNVLRCRTHRILGSSQVALVECPDLVGSKRAYHRVEDSSVMEQHKILLFPVGGLEHAMQYVWWLVSLTSHADKQERGQLQASAFCTTTPLLPSNLSNARRRDKEHPPC